MVLFLALTSVCGGLGIRNASLESIEGGTDYSATVSTNFGTYTADTGFVPADLGTYGEFAAAQDYDMLAGMRVGAGDLDALVEGAAQVDMLVDPDDGLTMGDVERASGLKLSDFAGASVNEGYEAYPVYLAKLSQVNAALELVGYPALELGAGECAVFSDSDITAGFYERAIEEGAEVEVGGRAFKLAAFRSESLMTTPFPMNTGTVVVPDESVPASAVILQSHLSVQCATDEDEEAFGELASAVADTSEPDTWPVTRTTTRTLVAEQNVGLSTIVAYLAIYLGFVLVVACAAILAIQQLSDASDSAGRYGLLRKLGAPENMVSASQFVQVLVYFLFPLLLAVAHSVCALVVVTDVVAVFGHLDIGATALACAACFLAVYGAYFAVTFFGARKLAKG